ncbi:MAG TPA: 23S rRNA (adenine(2503)-C(2))-methyltransferase RlmN [Pseudomonadales bacterium]|nr:23S rRNA (adenine(2503)-C(2))-methyltransferase RlmN [Pseudomonadales bacterium]
MSEVDNTVVTTGDKVNLLGLSPQKLEEFFLAMGEKKFRAAQVAKWIHQHGVDQFELMSNIARPLRIKLAEVAEIRPPELVEEFESADGTRKWLIRVSGGSCVETVFIPEKGRGTLCISSQVGCSLDCSFCATGKQGFQRDLTAAEIVGQVWLAARSFNSLGPQSTRVISNIVLMGMGEPLLNFHNVVDAVNLFMSDNGYGLSKRRVTLSTSGVVPMLDELGKYTDVSLALSLHAPNDALRDQLVPINRKYPIAVLLASVKRYMDGLPDNRRATIEYTLIDGVNDRPEHARELAVLLKDIPSKINLIPFNPFSGSRYRRVSNNNLYRFRDILIEAGYVTTIRTTRGDDIAAACGQLAGVVNDRTQRSERYRRVNDAATVEVVRFVQGGQ